MGKIRIELEDDNGIITKREYLLENKDKIGQDLFKICELYFEREITPSIIESLKNIKAIGYKEDVIRISRNLNKYIRDLDNPYTNIEVHYKDLRKIVNSSLYFFPKDKTFRFPNRAKTYNRGSLINPFILSQVKAAFQLLLELSIIYSYKFKYVPLQNSYIISVMINDEEVEFDSTLKNKMTDEKNGFPSISLKQFEKSKSKHSLNYSKIMQSITSENYEEIVEELAIKLIDLWKIDYSEMRSKNQIEEYDASFEGFYMLFDYYQEESTNIKRRLVAFLGLSKPNGKRDKKQITGFAKGLYKWPLQSIDRGHFIARSIGGNESGENLFIQKSSVNRGSLYRAMERYCEKNVGTFCFSRPIYLDESDFPYMFEYGVLKKDGELWTNIFENVEIEK